MGNKYLNPSQKTVLKIRQDKNSDSKLISDISILPQYLASDIFTICAYLHLVSQSCNSELSV